MKKPLLIFISIFTIATSFAQDISGSWSGKLNVMGQELQIVFNIVQDKDIIVTTMDSPSQNVYGIATDRNTFNNNKLEIVINNLGIFFQGVVISDSIKGTFSQGGIPFPLTLYKSALKSRQRPQNPAPPFNYDIEEITFVNDNANATLSGTITKPIGNNKFPAVVLVAGSGPNDRDETILEHKPFWVIADYLTRNGFLVLRYDKRGIGSSTGKYNLATTFDFAEDAKLAIEYLKSRNDVDNSSIGIIGHSEGGIIAPIIAANDNQISFIVLLAGMGTKGIDLMLDQNEISMNAKKMTPEAINESLQIIKSIFEGISTKKNNIESNDLLIEQLNNLWSIASSSNSDDKAKQQFIESNKEVMKATWFRTFLEIDPSDYLKKTNCAVLAINGEKDRQVLADKNLSIIESSLISGGNKNFKIKKYTNLNHLFQNCETGYFDEYINIEETIDNTVLEHVTNWILSNINY